ncbi:MAG: excinuclease ABC subunit C [Reichenbachiella sp.]
MKKPHELKDIPTNPGVYKFFNSDNILIYVGKAKNLKKRISSYFNKGANLSLKTRKLVSEIRDIDYVIVNSEFDALLLENNLIKENQPKYNILLKDDKSFPFICISNERFPKIYSTRRFEKKEGEYFGPYSSVRALNNVLELIRQLYKIRTCSYDLSVKNIENKKYKVCLEYHINNCLGPCEGLQNESSYMEEIEQARHILKGNLKIVHDHFKNSMTKASNKLDFETAQLFKAKLESLENFQSKTVIFNAKMDDTDVITVSSTQTDAFVNFTQVQKGMINVSESFKIKKKLEEEDKDLLPTLVQHLRLKYGSQSNILLSNILFDTWDEQTKLTVPQIGDKKLLLDLSLKNALLFKKEQIQEASKTESHAVRVVKKLGEDLQLKTLPETIECFDNSNIQGTNPVASMVCFKKGKPSKKDYRHYKIKTVEGPDDFKSMNEVVYRRYKRLIDENRPLPNLIIVDGGKGQLSAACDALKSLDIYSKIPIIGIAKKLEEIYYPDDKIPVHISKKSESLKLIQQLRDEAHRFAITFHRNLRSKGQIESEIDQIKGIGTKTKTTLLKKYKSFSNITDANETDLIALVGKAKAKTIQDYIIKKGAK